MSLTKETIQQKKRLLSIQEMYRKMKTGQIITDQTIHQLKKFDMTVGFTAAIQMRISAFQELQSLEQERVLELELHQFIQSLTQEETEKKNLISKEYEELARLFATSQEKGRKAAPIVEQVKQAEDGHSKQPMQVIELLETR